MVYHDTVYSATFLRLANLLEITAGNRRFVHLVDKQEAPAIKQSITANACILVSLQKDTSQSNELRSTVIYFGVCWSIWFLQWSSRVWSSRSWEYGLSGLLGINRIQWSSQIAVVTGGR